MAPFSALRPACSTALVARLAALRAVRAAPSAFLAASSADFVAAWAVSAALAAAFYVPGLRVDVYDQTAGAYGAKIHETGSVLITLGTAQVIYQCLSEMPKASANIVRGSYPYGLFYRLVVDNAGGSVINWAKNNIPEIGSYENFFTLIESAQTDRKGLIFKYDEDINRGRWNIKDDKYEPADFARSVLEYLCNRLVKMMKEIDLNPVKMNIVCAGGGSTQKVWVDMLSKYLGTSITPMQAESLLGVAMMIKQK